MKVLGCFDIRDRKYFMTFIEPFLQASLNGEIWIESCKLVHTWIKLRASEIVGVLDRVCLILATLWVLVCCSKSGWENVACTKDHFVPIFLGSLFCLI